jgi:hypothetical protein
VQSRNILNPLLKSELDSEPCIQLATFTLPFTPFVLYPGTQVDCLSAPRDRPRVAWRLRSRLLHSTRMVYQMDPPRDEVSDQIYHDLRPAAGMLRQGRESCRRDTSTLKYICCYRVTVWIRYWHTYTNSTTVPYLDGYVLYGPQTRMFSLVAQCPVAQNNHMLVVDPCPACCYSSIRS